MNAAKFRTTRPTKPIPAWLALPGITLAVAWLLAGCSTLTPPPASDAVTQDKAPTRAGSRSSMAIRPDRRYIQPTPPSERDLAESAIIDVPNKRFTGSGEMMEPDREFVELPVVESVRKKKPGLPPSISVDLATGAATLLPSTRRATHPGETDELESPGLPVARTPALQSSFEGMGSQTVAPSDAEIAAGPDTLIQAVNDGASRYRLLDKSGTVIASALQSDLHGLTICCDARAVFDTHSQRYFLMSLVNSCTPRIAVAMSKTASPTNLLAGTPPANDWLTWTFAFPGSNRIPDFPMIGVDEDALYVTANVFRCTGLGGFLGANLMVIPKAQLLAGDASPTTTVFAALAETWSLQDFPAFGLVPAVTHGRPGFGILAEITATGSVNDGVTSLDASFVTLYIVQDPATTTPTLTDLPVFAQPISFGALSFPDAPQAGSAALIETNGPGMHGATYRDGSLWVSLTGAAGLNQTLVSWTEIDVAKALDPATFLMGWEQGGFVQDASRSYYYPKITADAAGNAGLVMCASSSSEFASVYFATRGSDDPADTFQTPALMKAGSAVYDNPGRWGDYSGIDVDPSDGMTFWATAVWAKVNNTGGFDRWSTWIGSFGLPAQTATLPIFEDFEASARAVTPGIWSLVTGTVDTSAANEPSGSLSARLNGPPRGQDQFRTRQIDLSGLSNVEASYWMQRGGNASPPASFDLLTVDYLNADGNWANLQTFTGTDAAETAFAEFVHVLPPDAYHERFRLRFSTATSFTGADWFIDDVRIRDLNASACPFTCFDVNGDNNIDLFDFALFAACFQVDPIVTQECVCSDFDGNQTINLFDFARFAASFGQPVTFTPPDCP